MPGVISVGLPDGSTRELAEGTTAGELAQSIGSRLAKAAVVATVDGREVDLESPLPDGWSSATPLPTSWPRPCADCGRGPSTPSGR